MFIEPLFERGSGRFRSPRWPFSGSVSGLGRWLAGPSRPRVGFWQVPEAGSRLLRMTTGRPRAFSVSQAGLASGRYGSAQCRAVIPGQGIEQNGCQRQSKIEPKGSANSCHFGETLRGCGFQSVTHFRSSLSKQTKTHVDKAVPLYACLNHPRVAPGEKSRGRFFISGVGTACKSPSRKGC